MHERRASVPEDSPATRLALPALCLWCAWAAVAADSPVPPQLWAIGSGGVEVVSGGTRASVRPGERLGNWTLMAVVTNQARPLAVFEDFTQGKGELLYLGTSGLEARLPKSLEPTFAEPATLYRGHTLKEVTSHDQDLLAEEILAKPADPQFEEVAACFPPINKMKGAYTFVGTQENLDKVGIFYGGGTPTFDPAVYVPAIEKIRQERRVLDGLVGGWLPAVRFVYPEKAGDWSEMIAFAPLRVENGNARVQPVWYRVSRVEGNLLKWARYFDSYHPFPPRAEPPPAAFYEDLLDLRAGWGHRLAPAMQLDLPDKRVEDMARHSLVRSLMTRNGVWPKYGVFERSYGGSEHDGFPDTFTVDTTAMLEWGLVELAGQYIQNYFDHFVRDDGSILYRGPETGQYGRMLTVVAQYVSYSGDGAPLFRHRRRLEGVAGLLLELRRKALQRAPTDPAHGMISGWSEADACLDPEPERYMQPYLSNSSEAARGFHDLGAVCERVGRERNDSELLAWGRRLVEEAKALDRDLQTAIGRSLLRDTQPVCLPAIAGAKEPFHVAVARDRLDPQFRSYRANMEMLFSGNLTRQQVETVVRYRAAHRDTILGIPTCYGYNSHEWAGFLSYGHGYGLIQYDFTREFLLSLYSLMAHHYTRGTWTAPETRNIDPAVWTAPYCTPAQLVGPLLTRWMLVFEEPFADALWLAKATPRQWLEDGRGFSVRNAPTRWGRVSFNVRSHLREGRIEVRIEVPETIAGATVRLRLRAPEGQRLRAVECNGQPWTRFDAAQETITLPAPQRGPITLTASYR